MLFLLPPFYRLVRLCGGGKSVFGFCFIELDSCLRFKRRTFHKRNELPNRKSSNSGFCEFFFTYRREVVR